MSPLADLPSIAFAIWAMVLPLRSLVCSSVSERPRYVAAAERSPRASVVPGAVREGGAAGAVARLGDRCACPRETRGGDGDRYLGLP